MLQLTALPPSFIPSPLPPQKGILITGLVTQGKAQLALLSQPLGSAAPFPSSPAPRHPCHPPGITAAAVLQKDEGKLCITSTTT